MDYKLEIETNWLKNEIDWEKKQNRNIEKEQKAKNMPTGRKQIKQTLIIGKKVREHKKHLLFYGLRDNTYLVKDFLY